jgi:sugar phosphate isomerase/epimerase
MRWPVGYVALDSVMETWDADRVLDSLATLGFEAVDWSFAHFDPLVQSPKEFCDLVNRTRARGLEVPQLLIAEDLVTPDTRMWEERVQRTTLAVEAAAQAGVRSVGVATGPHRWNQAAARVGVDLTEPEAWELAELGLRRFVSHAEGTGVRIALEPVWGSLVDSGARLQRMLDSVPGLGVTFDPSHLVLPGDDIPAWIDSWNERIVHVHLKDGFGVRGMEGVDFFFPLLGEGQVPWREVFRGLAAANYAGFMSIEAESYRLLRQCYENDPTGPAKLSLELAHRLYEIAQVEEPATSVKDES